MLIRATLVLCLATQTYCAISLTILLQLYRSSLHHVPFLEVVKSNAHQYTSTAEEYIQGSTLSRANTLCIVKRSACARFCGYIGLLTQAAGTVGHTNTVRLAVFYEV